MNHPAEEDDVLVHECALDASPEKVWRAITRPEFLERWIGTPPSTETEGDGGRNGDPAYSLLDANPPTTVRYRWHDPRTDRPHSLVTIEIAPGPEGGTLFRLTHQASRTMPAAANGNCRQTRMAA